ncbi:MAG: sulfotransferase [Caldilinea sp.]|nr:sulfotransferase [Caldilineaceae bacterium]MCB9140749.1 sulfotransferase [Anaerolineales bacterium]MCO5209321.1 sulfotransferase [Caldilinea sp.]
MANPTGKVAILIVNGGHTSSDDRWIRLCLERIARFTVYPEYHIYLWNNRLGAPQLDTWLLARPRLTLLTAAPYEQLHHPYRTPLQRLYHQAREEGATYIVTLDSDAHPLKAGWLTPLLAALGEGAALAGVWRDEMGSAIRPYVHPCCLCTTVDFVERHQLRFDFNDAGQPPSDNLSHFTWVAEAEGLPIRKLTRSNRRSFHYLMGAIYGGLIYHHGVNSREPVSDRISAKGDAQNNHFSKLRDEAATHLFNDDDSYLGWLRGEDAPAGCSDLFEQLDQLALYTAVGGGEKGPRLHRAKGVLLDQFRNGRDLRTWKTLIRSHLRETPVVGELLTRLAGRIRDPRKEISKFVTNPFTMEDLAPPSAHGWTIEKPPDYVGIGSPKAGTTWWHALLLEHPQVAPNRTRRKELHYFEHFQHTGMTPAQIELYRLAFASPPGAICGEFSPTYLAYPHCIEHLATAAPETKIIVILRNPVDRFISHLNHLKRGPRRHSMSQNMSEQQLKVYDTFSCYSEATLHSLYSVGLAQLFRHFDRKQILILQFEKSVVDPPGELARTYSFLGVDNRYAPRNITAPHNVRPYVIAKPSAQERARLAACFADDVARTCALCPEIELSLWPDFMHQA